MLPDLLVFRLRSPTFRRMRADSRFPITDSRAIKVLTQITAALVFAVSAFGQSSSPLRAFELSITPWIGISGFGTRFTSSTQSTRYKSSLSGGARADMPLTRRLGILANVGISPFAQLHVESPFGSGLEEKATVYRGDVGVGWRFKPQAPIFFYLGGGVVGASRAAFPGVSKSILDPTAAFSIGYDGRRESSFNVRAVFSNYLAFPSDNSDTPAGVRAESTAYDWSLQLGARYSPRAKR